MPLRVGEQRVGWSRWADLMGGMTGRQAGRAGDLYSDRMSNAEHATEVRPLSASK